MKTRSAPELPAIKVNRWYVSLAAGLVMAIIACVVIPLVQPAARDGAVAGRQRAKLAELEQARERWDARPLSRYRLVLQVHPRDGSVCENAFEVHEPAQTKLLSDTCADINALGMGDDFSSMMHFLGSRTTIPGLFDYIEFEIGLVGRCGGNGCACDGARTIDVVYDTERGYPKRIEERFYQDWTTQRLHLGCSAMATILPSPVTVSVNPIE